MKKLTLIALAAAAVAGNTSCSESSRVTNLNDFYTQRMEAAKTFQDSLIATDGSFIGGFFNLQSERMLGAGADKNEILRGMRDVLATDTANADYLVGIRIGLSVFDVYKQLSASESFSKEAFISTISEAFRLDSVSDADVEKLQPLFQQMFTAVEEQAKKREEAKIFNTKEATQNRMIGDAIAEKYQANPEFSAVGSEGLMVKVITEGDGEVINPNSPVVVSISEKHADSGHGIRSLGATPMLAGRPNHPVLSSVIPFMSVGETAEFLVPYALAYGVSGNDRLGVGPCEMIVAEVKIEPFVAGDDK